MNDLEERSVNEQFVYNRADRKALACGGSARMRDDRRAVEVREVRLLDAIGGHDVDSMRGGGEDEVYAGENALSRDPAQVQQVGDDGLFVFEVDDRTHQIHVEAVPRQGHLHGRPVHPDDRRICAQTAKEHGPSASNQHFVDPVSAEVAKNAGRYKRRRAPSAEAVQIRENQGHIYRRSPGPEPDAVPDRVRASRTAGLHAALHRRPEPKHIPVPAVVRAVLFEPQGGDVQFVAQFQVRLPHPGLFGMVQVLRLQPLHTRRARTATATATV